jgi:hypothetical protein
VDAASASASEERRERLATLVRRQSAEIDCCGRAEIAVRASVLRDRLDEIGVVVTPDVAAALMAAAMLLASGTPEWGGDYRDALADLAGLGLELFDG